MDVMLSIVIVFLIINKYISRGVEVWSINMSHDGGVYDMFVDDDDKIFVCLKDSVVNGKQISLLLTYMAR